jgi:hypothetical protein
MTDDRKQKYTIWDLGLRISELNKSTAAGRERPV